MTTHESIIAILDAKNEKLQARVWELEAEIEKVRESIGIVQAENVRLRDLLAEVIACDEESGRNPISGVEIFLERRCVTLTTVWLARAKELVNGKA